MVDQLMPWRSMRMHQWDDHVADINRFVDGLRTKRDGFVPYVSPEFGGRDARVLLLNLSPGKGTDPKQGGSGFLSVRNPDNAAERIGEGLAAAGLAVSDCVAWNVYPWYVRGLSDKPADLVKNHMTVGFPALRDLFDLLPELRAVVVFGGDAQKGWEGFRVMYPKTAKRVRMLGNRSTADRAYISRSQAQIAEWRSELIDTLKLAKQSAEGPKRQPT
ncbi:uracil-DNA glycosylase [Gordonia jinhuaensis]|uniref:Uracil DNA glycosylase superfamily protein n=1 Tax=Gordonia jinhuaensis TaxID=1517702 RepID=A0A916TJM3_9ACTN|nr:hypothetical protein [Gordonia jinhuaensis]GGB48600.1 hypothetical protein GCM10011489_39660 [Gordonia jinhuaensis]